MQGYKGAAPQPHQRKHQQVVKAVVDHATQRAALLLADSSCWLVSLAPGSTTPELAPIVVPAPCTDACFLRLQAYGPAGAAAAAKPSGNGSTGLPGSPSRLGLGEVGQGESPTSRGQELREKGAVGRNGKGKVSAGVRRELYVVSARPGKGGSCTDLRAWSCADPAFAGAEIELEPGDGRLRASGRVFARLDAPHGLAVKMAASINVLVVYSSSAGIRLFWTFPRRGFSP
jgi:hypothetical protein